MQNGIYQDIATRTGGDIYIGVVGPVRTGKSTFIKKFMEKLIIPMISDKRIRARMQDEMPQSADGKTIMTTEPKFVPEKAVGLKFGDVGARVRLIDCVGYLIDESLGATEDGRPRMVKTPWSATEIPFEEAGEIGTEKVIKDHSTIGIVVTTDGSITDIDRSSYVAAEERAISELQSIGKPFVVILNSKTPASEETEGLRARLEDKYGVRVIAMNIEESKEKDFGNVMTAILLEFPVTRVDVVAPKWMRTLSLSTQVIEDITKKLKEADVSKLKDYVKLEKILSDVEDIKDNYDVDVDAGKGIVRLVIEPVPEFFYKVLSGWSGTDIADEFNLMSYVKRLSGCEKDYESIRRAMTEVDESGYGIIIPSEEKISLEEPEIIKKGNRFAVTLRANAPTYHVIKVDVGTEMSPALADGQQNEDVAKYLVTEYENDKDKLWEANMFGKSLSTLVKEDLLAKVENMPQDARGKMKKTVTRIVNEGRGGVLCILL